MQLLLLFKKSLRSSDSKPRKVEAEKDVVTMVSAVGFSGKVTLPTNTERHEKVEFVISRSLVISS